MNLFSKVLTIGLATVLTTVVSAEAKTKYEKKAERREKYNAKIIPNEKDRKGIRLAFVLKHVVLLSFYPDEISEKNAIKSLTYYCGLKGKTPQKSTREKDKTVAENVTMPDGTKRVIYRATVRCN